MLLGAGMLRYLAKYKALGRPCRPFVETDASGYNWEPARHNLTHVLHFRVSTQTREG